MSTKFPGGIITKNYTPPTTSSASGIWTLDQQDQAQQAGIWPFGGPFNYIEDVFSTWLYTGTGATQTITNGIDLSTYGGMVWMKNRVTAYNNAVVDSARGLTSGRILYTNSTATQQTGYPENGAGISSFNSNGFTLRADSGGVGTNYASGENLVSWSFRKQPKFFDVVTWTGDGTANRQISHTLGSTPGMVIIKRTDTTANWKVSTRCTGGSISNSASIGFAALLLNLTNADGSAAGLNNGYSIPEATYITLASIGGSYTEVNASGGTYVAYIFASNAGGFGLTGTDNVITCGSFTPSSGNATVNLGYEPQWILIKNTAASDNWQLLDTMRSWDNTNYAKLFPNTSDAEGFATNYYVKPTSTGFNITNFADQTYIYIAIRRGPMKVPTDATKVFLPQSPNSSGSFPCVVTNFPVDMGIVRTNKTTTGNNFLSSRLQGQVYMFTNTTAAEASDTSFEYDSNVGYLALSGASSANWAFARAPSFFDEVCFNGSATDFTINHNLQAIPELIILKKRSGVGSWFVGGTIVGFNAANNNNNLFLNNTNALATATIYTATWTSTAMYMSGGANFTSGTTAVAYLFATCAGVSKVGTYTGNGTTQAIACGFTGGARFVLIKRTDATGNWYVYDTARGMTTLTDPYLFLNSTAAETATLGSVTTTTGGFTLNESILTGINTSSATYIFLAIA